MKSVRPQLRRLLKKWTPILKIQDWTIDVHYARKSSSSTFKSSEAYCTYTSSLKEASIFLLDPIDYDPGVVIDIEAVLVHELVHIVMDWASYSQGDPEYIPWEQSVESLSKALITLDRRKGR